MKLFFFLLSWSSLRNFELQNNIKFPVSLHLKLIYDMQIVLISKLTSNFDYEPCDTRSSLSEIIIRLKFNIFRLHLNLMTSGT